jgi:hypothetical protein
MTARLSGQAQQHGDRRQLRFQFPASVIAEPSISPLRVDDEVDVVKMPRIGELLTEREEST